MWQSSYHLFIQQTFLSAYHVPWVVLGAGDDIKGHMVSVSLGLHMVWKHTWWSNQMEDRCCGRSGCPGNTQRPPSPTLQSSGNWAYILQEKDKDPSKGKLNCLQGKALHRKSYFSFLTTRCEPKPLPQVQGASYRRVPHSKMWREQFRNTRQLRTASNKELKTDKKPNKKLPRNEAT